VADDDLLRQLNLTLERNAQAFEDLQVVIRDSATREERALTHFEQALDAWTQRVSEQLEANTAAVWRMLDRWGEGPTPAS
jgi:phage-related minor tail protein